MAIETARRRFTADEYLRMAEAGILTEDDRVELIDGEIVEMSPTGRRHVAAVNRCNRVFSRSVGARALVSIQNPVHLAPYDEPEPDVVLLRPRADDYADELARPADILLLVEVADSSLEYDRQTKLPLYAAAGIPEAWLLNLREHRLEVHREPSPTGYVRSQVYRPGERVAPLAFPDVETAVADLLPPGAADRDDRERR
jgi:Uma2 family endonuclease